MARTTVSAAVSGCSPSPSSSYPIPDSFPKRPTSGLDNMEERLEDRRDSTGDYGTINHAMKRQQPFSSGMSDGNSRGDDEVEEDEHEEDRLTPDSYRRTVLLYSLVPITAVLTILFFILLHRYLWPSSIGSATKGTYIVIAFLGAAIWTVSFALRIPLYILSTYLCRTIPASIPFISASLQVFFEESLRLSSIILAQIHIKKHVSTEDPAFSHIWTLALGWAAAEVAVSIAQGYAQLALYSDVTMLDIEELHSHYVWTMEEQLSLPAPGLPRYPPETEADRVFFNAFDKLLRARARVELETLYGVSVPQIPVFVSCLLRIDSILLSLALFLIISSSYLSYLSFSFTIDNPLESLQSAMPTFLGVVAFHILLGFGWTPDILPRIGLHAASYVSCIFALGAFFIGLAMWEAI